MFLFNRKSRAQPKESWNRVKFEYEAAIERCYKWKSVRLAVCGFRRFSAFNFIQSQLEGERKAFIDSDFQLWGVVHEESSPSKHIQCRVNIFPTTVFEDSIGWFVLEEGLSGDKTPPENRALQLEVTLLDPTSMLNTTLIDSLRDAALSGFQFIHVGLECPESTSEQSEKALSDMRTQGYASRRQILAIKTWPKLELQNAPKWARLDD
jgi:hypothetical protein